MPSYHSHRVDRAKSPPTDTYLSYANTQAQKALTAPDYEIPVVEEDAKKVVHKIESIEKS